MDNNYLTRRESMLAMGAAAAGMMLLNGDVRSVAAETPSPKRRRAIRVAHLTDVHVQPEQRAAQGLAACLKYVQENTDSPQLILTGGDHIMDSFEADDARTSLQWQIWQDALKQECSPPVHSCIGNHDIWGWNKAKSKTTGRESTWGKRRATEMLHLDQQYYSFDQNGWRFILLDSTQPIPGGGDGYTAHVDEAQYEWLERTLAETPAATPVLVLSHIPILSAAALFFSPMERGGYNVGGWLMHTDFEKLKNLFVRYPNVKLCLSGHLHLCDRVDYNGVTYLCNGAVSGNWWGGRHKDCDEGYAILDLYDDGSFDHQYVKYGWKAVV